MVHVQHLTAFEQGGIFIVPHLLLPGPSVFAVSPEGSIPTQSDSNQIFSERNKDLLIISLIPTQIPTGVLVIWKDAILKNELKLIEKLLKDNVFKCHQQINLLVVML